MFCTFPNLPIICLVYMQQLLKGTQCHSNTRAATFTVKTGRLLLLDLPWASYVYRLDCEVKQPSTEKATLNR